jgi:hypothetical protein
MERFPAASTVSGGGGVAWSRYREQAYVKHVFLERYLERLVHKTASCYDYIVYIDGFAGPWQSSNESFQDTSLGIALHALRQAKATCKTAGREVKMSAYLVPQRIKYSVRDYRYVKGRNDHRP